MLDVQLLVKQLEVYSLHFLVANLWSSLPPQHHFVFLPKVSQITVNQSNLWSRYSLEPRQ